MKSVSLLSVLIFTLCGFWQMTASPCEAFEKAVVENGIIKGATHYYLSLGGKKMVCDPAVSPDPVEVEYGPRALFYGYNHAQKLNNFLGRVDIKDFDPTTLAELDSMLDPQRKLPTIKSAKISAYVKTGRIVQYFDENGIQVEYSHSYNGSIDIKSEPHSIGLIKPHYLLLNNLEQVTESKRPFWLFGFFGAPDKETVLRYK